MTLKLETRTFAAALAPSLVPAWAVACALTLGLSAAPTWAAPAQARVTHAKGNTRAAKHPATHPARQAAYAGQFSSECDQMADGLYTRDIVELQPLSPKRIQAKYHKAIFTTPSCDLASRLGTLHLPVALWELEGPVKATPGADRVTVHMPEGKITATVDQPEKMKETEQNWVLTIGNEQVPIDKASTAMQERDLRLLEGEVLYFGDPGSPDAQSYPQEALRNHPLTRIKPGKASH